MNRLIEANVLVTTTPSPTNEEEELAIELAGLLGSSFGIRDSCTISSLVRILGSFNLPSLEIINEARRVAKRSVVIKDRLPGEFLNAMEVPIVSDSKRVWYGRLDASYA